MNLDNAFDKAKIDFIGLGNSIFLSTIFFSLEHIWEKDIATAGTDGLRILINPKFFLELSPKERVFLLAHETWHVALDHMTRGLKLNKQKYNIAGDYVINLMLKENGFSIIKDALIDSKYKNMSTEKVYSLLPDDCVNTYNSIGLDINYEENSNKAKKIAAKINSVIMKATTQVALSGSKKEIGKLPKELQLKIDEIKNPKIEWQALLSNYIQEYTKNDYSFIRPNKRFLPKNYLPSLYSLGIKELVAVYDVSGSVSRKELSSYVFETEQMREIIKPVTTRIITIDTQVHEDFNLSADQKIKDFVITGGGGTNLKDVFKLLKKSAPTLVIIFSDLYCEAIKIKPNYSVIWIVVNNKKAKTYFGKQINYEV